MAFKFSLKKPKVPEGGQSNSAPPNPPLSPSGTNWTEKTVESWQEHSSFIERTRISGINPPIRGGTITGLIVKEKQRDQWRERAKLVLLALIIPLTSISFYFYLSSHTRDKSADFASETPTTAKAPALAPAPSSAPVAVSAPTSVAASGSIGTASAPQNAVVSAARDEGFIIKDLPYSLGAQDPTYRPPAANALKSLFKLSGAPSSPNSNPSRPVNSVPFNYSIPEKRAIAGLFAHDVSAMKLATEWRNRTQTNLGRGSHPIAQFKFDTQENRFESLLARADIENLDVMRLDLIASGRLENTEQLQQSLQSWVRHYIPVGDVYSDSEIAPLFEIVPFVQPLMAQTDQVELTNWLLLIADREATEALSRPSRDDRWFAHHLKTMMMIGFLTGNPSIQDYVRTNLPSHIASAILEDGSTTTLKRTDSLELHIDHITKLTEIVQAYTRIGWAEYTIWPTANNPLGKAFDFCQPWILGQQTRTEFKALSDLDLKKRQAAGDISLAPHPFEPKTATRLLETLVYFQPRLLSELSSVSGHSEAHYASGRALLFDSMARDVKLFEPSPRQGGK